MGIPLNIDWQQILLHLFNFIILAGGLYLLLFKPIKAFMEKRNAYYQDLDAQANSKLEEAKALEAAYQKKMDDADDEIRQKRIKAGKDADQAADAQLLEARQQAQKVIENARREAVLERTKMLAEAQEEIARLAVEATEKLLEQSGTETFDAFVQAARGGQENAGQ